MRATPAFLFVPLIVAAAVAAPTSAGEPEQWVARLWDANRPGVARLVGFGNGQASGGTGFLIRLRNREVLITNAHVIAGVGTMAVKFDGLEPLDCKLIDQNSEFDLAALQLEKPLPTRVLALFDNRAQDPNVGAPIVIIGHPERLPTSIHSGIVSAEPLTLGVLAEAHRRVLPNFPQTRVYQLNVTSTQGMSGAPVLDSLGRVVGVEQQGWEPGLTDINFCIPHSYIHQLDLDKVATAFPGGDTPYAQTNQNSLQGLREPADNVPPDGPPALELAELRCRQFGVFPRDPDIADFIFHQMVGQGNKERFQRLIPRDQLAEIATRHNIYHVINPAFGFGFLVPDNYRLSEELVSRNPVQLKITLTNTAEDIPAPYNLLTIWVKSIAPATPQTVGGTVFDMAGKFPGDVLNLRIHPPSPPGVPFPETGLSDIPFWTTAGFFQNDNDVLRIYGGMSDANVTTHPTLPIARVNIGYDSFVPDRNSRMFHYAVAGVVAVATSYEYPTFAPVGQTTADLAERRFIAETINVYYPGASDND